MTDLANIPFAPRHEPGRWQPANYEEQEAAKVPRALGGDWMMCRSDASMHRYRVNGPFWWVAFRYSSGQITVHLCDTLREVRFLINRRVNHFRCGTYHGHGRVRFKQ